MQYNNIIMTNNLVQFVSIFGCLCRMAYCVYIYVYNI